MELRIVPNFEEVIHSRPRPSTTSHPLGHFWLALLSLAWRHCRRLQSPLDQLRGGGGAQVAWEASASGRRHRSCRRAPVSRSTSQAGGPPSSRWADRPHRPATVASGPIEFQTPGAPEFIRASFCCSHRQKQCLFYELCLGVRPGDPCMRTAFIAGA